MKWVVDGDSTFYDIDDLCDYLFDPEYYDDNDDFEEWINDTYYNSDTEIAGRTFTAAEIVRSCDDDLWNELKSEWQEERASQDRSDAYYDLQNMDIGDTEYYNGYEVELVMDDEDDSEEEEEEETLIEKFKEEDSITDQASMESFIKDLVCNFQKI